VSISCCHEIATLKVLLLTLIECVRRAEDSSDDMDNLALGLEVLRLEVASAEAIVMPCLAEQGRHSRPPESWGSLFYWAAYRSWRATFCRAVAFEIG